MSAAERLVPWYCMIQNQYQENRGPGAGSARRLVLAYGPRGTSQHTRMPAWLSASGNVMPAKPQPSAFKELLALLLTSQQSPAPRHQYIYRQLHGGVQLTLR